jgi:hypothetical protein
MTNPKDGRSRNVPNGGKGRPKGTPNKLTRDARQAFQYAFEKVGGADQLAAWAKDNAGEFYKLFARLIPVDNRVSDPDGKPLHFTLYVPNKDV